MPLWEVPEQMFVFKAYIAFYNSNLGSLYLGSHDFLMLWYFSLYYNKLADFAGVCSAAASWTLWMATGRVRP